jgi:hypothetical protein
MSSFTQQQIEWARQVRLDKKVADKAVRIADALAFDYMNAKTLDAWPAMATICARVDASERAVRRALDQLVERGHLTIKSGGGRNKSNRYSWIIQPGNTGKNAGVLDGETLAYAEEFTRDEKAKPRQKRHINSGSFGTKTLANMPEEPSEENRLKEPDGGSALGRASASTDYSCGSDDDHHDHDVEAECGSEALEPLAASTDLASDDPDLHLNHSEHATGGSAARAPVTSEDFFPDCDERDDYDAAIITAEDDLAAIYGDPDFDMAQHLDDACEGLSAGDPDAVCRFRRDLQILAQDIHPARREAVWNAHFDIITTFLAAVTGGRPHAEKVVADFVRIECKNMTAVKNG